MILIAIGANLSGPDGAGPLQSCKAAADAVRALPGLTFVAQSRWYRSAAVPVSDQPDYCNGVMRFSGSLSPLALLHDLQSIETRFGRVRSVPNAARTLDLDLIDLNGVVLHLPQLVLPHPRAHERAFVLTPLQDVAPAWVHPRLGQDVGSLRAALQGAEIDLWR